MALTKVLLVGAAGATGGSIADGLLEDGSFELTALVRPPSADHPRNIALKEKGVKIVIGELSGPEEDLIKILTGMDVVISAVGQFDQKDQLPLVHAAKKAGVKRFVPSGWISVVPPGGIMGMRDRKEEVYNLVHQLHIPYTIIDVGWWYQASFPALPSGRNAGALIVSWDIVGEGSCPVALTDVNNIGRYVARIIKDDRTLNKMVLAYDEALTQHQAYDVVEKVSGETIPRKPIPAEVITGQIAAIRAKGAAASKKEDLILEILEYQNTWGIRGDNDPEYAKYLGYVTTKELYPDSPLTKFEDFIKDTINGTRTKPFLHQKNVDLISEVFAS